MLKAITIVAALAAATIPATASFAGSQRLTDVQYMQAARCEAPMAAPALGGGDSAEMKALIKAQRQGRAEYISVKSDELRSEAARQARSAGDERKARLIAERDGVCRSLLGVATSTQTSVGAAVPRSVN